MKKQLVNLRIIVLGSMLLLSKENLLGQTVSNSPSPVGEMCGSAHLHKAKMQNDPAYAARTLEYEQYVQSINDGITPKAPAQYKIPVVIHVLHKGEAVGVGTNVSDESIRNTIKELNNRYRKIAGTGGAGNGVDTEIEFVLAVRNPSGQCTNGINRVSMTSNSAYMTYGVRSTTSQGITDAQCKAVASWDRTKYYNIYLVSEIDNNEGGAGTQGYAYFASSHGNPEDGAVMLASNFTAGNSMTLTHELGHALNLYHTFQGDGSGATCPPVNGCSGTGVGGEGDCCGDIPAHKRSQSDCNVTGTNTCNGVNSSNELFARNYMDYASDACVNMFTANQKTRMLAACASSTVGRASFFATSNLALVPVAAPVANFIASKSIICSGQTVTFTDLSSCVPNTYLGETNWAGTTFSWTFTNGTVTLTSSVQNPTMTFTSPGSYNVTLTVTTPAGTNTYTQNNAVVLGGTVVNACTPTSQNTNTQTGQTISNVRFNTINNTTSQIVNVAYTNFVCTNNTIVTAGNTYSLTVTANAGPSSSERFEVYIDYNNNGTFENPSELVHSGSAPVGSQTALGTVTTSANVVIPATAVTNTTLRMRVIGEAAASISAAKRGCTGQFFIGDVEDYGVYISAPTSSGCTTAPTIGTQPAASTICAGANTSFTIASTGAASYKWQVSTNGGTTWTDIANGGVYSTATTTSLTITGATTSLSTYRYRCVTTNTCGSTNSSAVILTVNASPTVTATTPGSRCGTGTVTLGATASAGTLTWYTAQTAGTTIGTGTSVTTPSISTTTTYYVSAANAGCTSARTAVVATVNANVAATASNTTICAGASTTLTATGGSSYTWTGGQTGASITVSPTTTTTYTVTGVTSCTSTANVTVTVNPLPNTTFAALPSLCVNNAAFALTGGSPAGGTYSGPGVSGGNFNPATAGVGTSTLTYTVTQSGCSKSATSQITVNACAGIEDQDAADLLILYPNPVEGWMTIEGENLSKYNEVLLLDISGRLVSSWKVDNNKMNIDLSGFASGQYTVNIVGSEKGIIRKIEILK